MKSRSLFRETILLHWKAIVGVGGACIVLFVILVALFIIKLLATRSTTLQCECPAIHTIIDERASVQNPEWSPDGGWIAFDKADISDDGSLRLNGQIYFVSTDGKEVHKLTGDDKNYQYPTWSPDGRKLAFTTFLAGFPDEASIEIVDIPTGQVASTLVCSFLCSSTKWSPDNKWIAFEMQHGSKSPARQQFDLWLVDSAFATKPVLLTENVRPWGIAWSPSAKQIFFVSDENPSIIKVFTLDGTLPVASPFPSFTASYPASYPAVDRIAYVQNHEIIYNSLNSSSTNPQPVLDPTLIVNWASGFAMYSPALSPDGNRVAFIYGEAAQTGLYIADLP